MLEASSGTISYFELDPGITFCARAYTVSVFCMGRIEDMAEEYQSIVESISQLPSIRQKTSSAR